MDAPTTPPPCPWKPGELTVTASPRWGHAQVIDNVGHKLTILSSDHRSAGAAADMIAGYAVLEAERDRYRTALERLAGHVSDGATRFVARQALGLGIDPALVAAAFDQVEGGSLA